MKAWARIQTTTVWALATIGLVFLVQQFYSSCLEINWAASGLSPDPILGGLHLFKTACYFILASFGFFVLMSNVIILEKDGDVDGKNRQI